MRKLGWRQWVVLSLFAAALFLTSFFLVKTVRHALYWHYHQDETIRAWMPIHYVSRSYRVPPHVLYRAIGLPELSHDRRPLWVIAREQSRPVETLIKELQDAITHSRPPYPPPPPPQTHDGGPPE